MCIYTRVHRDTHTQTPTPSEIYRHACIHKTLIHTAIHRHTYRDTESHIHTYVHTHACAHAQILSLSLSPTHVCPSRVTSPLRVEPSLWSSELILSPPGQLAPTPPSPHSAPSLFHVYVNSLLTVLLLRMQTSSKQTSHILFISMSLVPGTVPGIGSVC